MNREAGYYWVRVYGFLKIAEWVPEMLCWYFTGNDQSFDDSDMDEIFDGRIVKE